jgi:AcrR family transcriptional regulator
VKAVREAGRLELEEFGPEKLTTTRIAERAGVSVGSLYQYFENKEAILRAIYDEMADENRSTIPDAIADLTDMDPRRRLRMGVNYAVARHQRMLELDPDYYRKHHDEYWLADPDPAVPPESAWSGPEWIRLARDLLRKEQPHLRTGVDIDHAAFLLGRGIDAILRAALEDSEELLNDPGFIDEVVEMMTRYLYPDDAGNPGAR